MANSLYPGFIRLFYNTNGHPHVQVIPCQPYVGVGGVYYVSEKNNSVGRVWTASVDAYANEMKAWLKTTDSINNAELWTLATPTADPVFIENYDITLAGTSAAANIPWSMLTITYRTKQGGVAKFNLMEATQLTINSKYNPPFTGALVGLNNYLNGTGSLFSGRDGSFFVAPIRAFLKTNDALRKKYLLDV